MRLLIWNGDQVMVNPVLRPRIGDVVLAVNPAAGPLLFFILHRVISITQDRSGAIVFVTKGDAVYRSDRLKPTGGDIWGVVTAVNRGDRVINLLKLFYRLLGLLLARSWRLVLLYLRVLVLFARVRKVIVL